eukprot:GCRY01006120.1.p1 GENE.GCRY01006120.1~~GCRY01006120.1.p1  ORF type:complete len:153 (-),score=22.95 GCRY01006120.1:52-510(-)
MHLFRHLFRVFSLSTGVTASFAAGFCAALSSVFGKLTVNVDSSDFLTTLLDNFGIIINPDFERYGYIGAFILCNVMMWAFFTLALNALSSSMVATALNLASNFLFTAVLGRIIFNEILSVLWFVGASLIATGVLLLTFLEEQKNATSKKKKE